MFTIIVNIIFLYDSQSAFFFGTPFTLLLQSS
jgi:hypothetical protein